MKHIYFCSALICSISTAYGWFLDDSTIRVANATDNTIYIAPYYSRSAHGIRITQPLMIPPDNALSFPLPSPKFLHSRIILSGNSPAELPEKIMVNHAYGAFIGMFYPRDYTVTQNPRTGQLAIQETEEWKKSLTEPRLNAHTLSTTLPETEQSFSTQRTAVNLQAQTAYCGHPLQRPLRIAICSSGGGFRALLAMAGLMSGLEKIGVLPLIHRCVGVSGSTWFLFPWIISGRSATECGTILTQSLTHGLLNHLTTQYKDFATLITKKKALNLPVNAIDFYSINLAYTLLKPFHPNPLALSLGDSSELLDPQKHPLIQGSMVTRPHPSRPYEWLLASPFATQFVNNKYCLPPDLLGAHFHNKDQMTALPAPLLSYYLAIFGSAPAVSVRDALDRAPQKLQKVLDTLLPLNWREAQWSNTKIMAGYVANPLQAIPHEPLAHVKTLGLVDGSYLNNLPLEPLLRTAPEPYDVIICLDCNQKKSGRPLRFQAGQAAAQEYTAVAFPPIDTDAMITKPFSIHRAEPGTTTIIHCTLEGSPDYDPSFTPSDDPAYATIKVLYSPAKAERLFKYLQYIITQHESEIKEVITDLGNQLRLSAE